MMSFTCLICINVSPMLSPDKIKNKLLGRLYKAFCDLGTTVLPRTHPQTCWVHVPMLPWLRLFSQAGGLPSTQCPQGKPRGSSRPKPSITQSLKLLQEAQSEGIAPLSRSHRILFILL